MSDRESHRETVQHLKSQSSVLEEWDVLQNRKWSSTAEQHLLDRVIERK